MGLEASQCSLSTRPHPCQAESLQGWGEGDSTEASLRRVLGTVSGTPTRAKEDKFDVLFKL